jgi:hypothetical protein
MKGQEQDKGGTEPDKGREAVGVDAAGRDQRRGDVLERQARPIPLTLAQRQHEGQQEQRLHRLLEGALGEVGGDDVGEADEEGAGGARKRGKLLESGKCRQAGENRNGDSQAAEPLDEADPEALVQGHHDRVRTERIALVQQLRGLPVHQPICRQQVLGHVGVEARPEDPEVPFDGERERGGQERPERYRPADADRLPSPLDPPPQVNHRRHGEHENDNRGDDPIPRHPHRPPTDRAQQRQPHTRRQPRPAPPAAEPDRRLPDRQRGRADRQHGCVSPDHETASLD